MKHSDKIAPAGAVAAALLSISCCLPLAIPAAFGLAGLGMFAGRYQRWLVGASVLLLIVGAAQLVRKPACQRRSPATIVLLCLAAVLVVTVALFPETLAGFLADHLP